MKAKSVVVVDPEIMSDTEVQFSGSLAGQDDRQTGSVRWIRKLRSFFVRTCILSAVGAICVQQF
jgi:hypothetical protein